SSPVLLSDRVSSCLCNALPVTTQAVLRCRVPWPVCRCTSASVRRPLSAIMAGVDGKSGGGYRAWQMEMVWADHRCSGPGGARGVAKPRTLTRHAERCQIPPGQSGTRGDYRVCVRDRDTQPGHYGTSWYTGFRHD